MTEAPDQCERNKGEARAYYDVIDRDGLAAGERFKAPGYRYYGADHTGFINTGPGSLARAYYAAFPDFTHVILDQIADGDVVVERIRYFATHRDTFMGIPATGRKITFTGMDWVTFKDGKAVTRWGVAEELSIRRQLLGLPEPVPGETNKALAREYYEVIDRYGPDAGKPYFAPEYRYYGANHTGFDGLAPAERARAYYAAMKDFTHLILDQIAEGDVVVDRIGYQATHSGTFMGVPASGQRVHYTGIDWVQFRDTKIAARWGVGDSAGLRRQLLGLKGKD